MSGGQEIDVRGAFESDTIHRLAVEAARFWVIECWLRKKELPTTETRFVYSDGPYGIGWGNAPGPDDAELKPLRYCRIKVTFEIEHQAKEPRHERRAGQRAEAT